MKGWICAVVFVSMITGTGFAQNDRGVADSIPAETNAPGVEFPRIDARNRALFRVEAPDAGKVQLDLGKVYDMVRDEAGIWTVTTDSLPPGFHYYYLMIDGFRFSDPASESFFGIGKMMSGIEIPASDRAFYTPSDVPHGQIRECTVYSGVTRTYQRVFVYSPPGYDVETSTRYPVLYLQHGMGEDERGWVNQGRLNVIMDNLIAEKRARPMVIVVSDGDIGGMFRPGPGEDVNEARKHFGERFTPMLLKEIIPYVEQNFRVLTDRDHRAMAGLSWGGFQTFQIALNHLDMFAHIGGFSGAGMFNPQTDLKTVYNGVFSNPLAFSQQVHTFFLGIGSAEGSRMKTLHEAFTAAGIHTTYYESPGTAHEWLTWRRCLYQFAPLLFQK